MNRRVKLPLPGRNSLDETPCQTQPRPADSPGLHQSSPKMAVRQPPEPVERTWLHQEGAERIFLVFLRFTVRQQTNQAPVLENLAERLSRWPRSRADHSIELQKNPRQMTDEGFRCLKNRRYLLSRFWHYHRLKVLNFCVRPNTAWPNTAWAGRPAGPSPEFAQNGRAPTARAC